MRRMLLVEVSSRSYPQEHGSLLCCLVLLALMIPTPGWTDEGRLSLTGYVKGFAMVREPVSDTEIRDPETQRILLNRVRLKLFWRPGFGVTGEFAYELSGRAPGAPSSDASRLPAPAPFDYRVKDLRTRLYPAPGAERRGFTITQNLDRAVVTISLPRADVYLGRQVVAFGSARVVNPTDVVAPYSPQALDKEERVGVDAIRLRVPVGMMGELDAGVIPGWDLSKKSGAGFVRGRFFSHGTDVYVMAMGFQDRLLLGVDLARSLGDAGAWLEAAWTRSSGGPVVSAGFDRSRLSIFQWCLWNPRVSPERRGCFQYTRLLEVVRRSDLCSGGSLPVGQALCRAGYGMAAHTALVGSHARAVEPVGPVGISVARI